MARGFACALAGGGDAMSRVPLVVVALAFGLA